MQLQSGRMSLALSRMPKHCRACSRPVQMQLGPKARALLTSAVLANHIIPEAKISCFLSWATRLGTSRQ